MQHRFCNAVSQIQWSTRVMVKRTNFKYTAYDSISHAWANLPKFIVQANKFHVSSQKSCWSRPHPVTSKLSQAVRGIGQRNIEVYREETWAMHEIMLQSRTSAIDKYPVLLPTSSEESYGDTFACISESTHGSQRPMSNSPVLLHNVTLIRLLSYCDLLIPTLGSTTECHL